MADDVADVLEKAAEVIERDGWCQNQLTDEAGRVCLVGAIEKAAFGEIRSVASMPVHDARWRLRCGAVDAVTVALGGGGLFAVPSRWNDLPGRDQFEVIDLLKSVAKTIRNEATA